MFKKLFALSMMGFAFQISVAQNSDVFFLGHSLVNFDMPRIFSRISESKLKNSEVDQQVINGASLNSNYANYASAQGTPYTTALATGNFENFVVTEAVPLLNHLRWSDTYGSATNLLNYARQYKSNVKFYIYETWHCINTGRTDTVVAGLQAGQECWYDTADSLLWQARLVDDFKLWRGIVDSVRERTNYPSVYMVPAGQAMHKLSLLIAADELPGLNSFRDLFTDDIHLNMLGNYFVACVMYATLYGESPEGVATTFNDDYGNFWFTVNAQVAQKMQEAAWQTVCEQSYSGVDCSTSTIVNKKKYFTGGNLINKQRSSQYDLLGRQFIRP